MAQVLLTDDAKEDLRDLDRVAQVLVLKGLKKLQTDPEKRGHPLGSKNGTSLVGFRKLTVGDRDYRIIYRVEENGDVCVVHVIGKRADNEVYEIAKARLDLSRDHEYASELTEMMAIVFR
jgi:mRNA interferase RelE/StbE